MAAAILEAARLRECIHYDPETGAFTRKVRLAHRHQVGDDATHPMSNGYMRVAIDSQRYLAHRIAWLYVHGEWPKNHIDHINGNRADNRLANLRDVSRSINQQNRRKPDSDNQSGLLGAHYHGQNRNWVARVRVNGRAKHIGSFPTPELAHEAYVEAKRRLHEGCTI